MTINLIDVCFGVHASQPLFADHSYALYGAISQTLPQVHSPNGIAIHPIRGEFLGERKIRLNDSSRLTIRVAAEQIGQLLPLAGKRLNVAGTTLLVGVPQVYCLVPATAVRSRLVTIKLSENESDANTLTPERFLSAVRRKLDQLGVAAAAEITLGKRRTLHIKQKAIVGYEVFLTGLTAEESLAVQSSDIWSRRHMGCGIFVALPEGAQP